MTTLQALTPADVRLAVLTARERGLRVAVRATGHGTFGEPDGALTIDTSAMTSVLVDPERRSARVGPGATWGAVIAAAAPFGLAPVSGTHPGVGVTGFTLGGGHGWLARKHGLAADSLVRADIVTADGDTLTARADRRSGLFWALRGAGGNFGVVTSLEFKLHPVAEVYGGNATFDRALAPALLHRFAEYTDHMPEELNVSVVLTPDAVALRGVHAGGADDALRALAPLLLADPLTDTFRPMPYTGTTTIGGTAPRRFELLRALPVDAILATRGTVEIKRWGGAIERSAIPAGHRDVPFSVTVDGDDVAPLAPHVTGGTFLNFLNDPARTRDAYTPSDYARLEELKRAYDPDNVFGSRHNIAPAVIPSARRSRAA